MEAKSRTFIKNFKLGETAKNMKKYPEWVIISTKQSVCRRLDRDTSFTPPPLSVYFHKQPTCAASS